MDSNDTEAHSCLERSPKARWSVQQKVTYKAIVASAWLAVDMEKWIDLQDDEDKQLTILVTHNIMKHVKEILEVGGGSALHLNVLPDKSVYWFAV